MYSVAGRLGCVQVVLLPESGIFFLTCLTGRVCVEQLGMVAVWLVLFSCR